MSIIDNVKGIADLIKQKNDIELYRNIVELEAEIIDLTRRNASQAQRISELEETLKVSEVMMFKEPFYYMEGKEDKYCPNCWDVNKITVHIAAAPIEIPGRYRFQCPNCKWLCL